MSESPKVYRESCRRLHRTMANYLAMLAWCNGAECVVLDRPIVERLFDVERLKEKREEWLREDMRPWFPVIHTLKYQGRNKAGCLYLSRISLDRWIEGTMTDRKRIEKMKADNVKAILIEKASDCESSELGMIQELALLATGLKSPEFNSK